MVKAVLKAHFPRLRSALKSSRLTWYAIDQDGHAVRATDQIIDAAIDEDDLWLLGELPTHAFVLGDPQDVTYEEIVSGRTERQRFACIMTVAECFLSISMKYPWTGSR